VGGAEEEGQGQGQGEGEQVRNCTALQPSEPYRQPLDRMTRYTSRKERSCFALFAASVRHGGGIAPLNASTRGPPNPLKPSRAAWGALSHTVRPLCPMRHHLYLTLHKHCYSRLPRDYFWTSMSDDCHERFLSSLSAHHSCVTDEKVLNRQYAGKAIIVVHTYSLSCLAHNSTSNIERYSQLYSLKRALENCIFKYYGVLVIITTN
jgi:hypothetical protein